jgi:hypothetical protein
LFQEKFKRSLMNIDESIIQTIPCIELRKADVVECPCAPPSGCYFLKSLHPIPKMLDGTPLAVTTLAPDCKNCDGVVREFDYVRWYNMQYKLSGRGPLGLYYTMKDIDTDSHLYVFVTDRYPELKAISVAGVFKDPLEVLAFPVCGQEAAPLCNLLDQEFIMEQELQAQVFEYVFQALGSFKGLSTGSDILNNDNPDHAAQVPN